MVVQSAAADHSATLGPHALLARLAYTATLSALVTWLLLGAWLAPRNVAGHLEPPGPLALAIVAIVLAGATSLLRIVWYLMGTRIRQLRSRNVLLWALPTLPLALLGFALSVEGTGAGPLSCFWIFLAAVEGFWWWLAWRQWRAHRSATPDDLARTAASPGPSRDARSVTTDSDGEAEEGDELLGEEVSQQLTRCRAEEDEDTVTGLLRARFGPQIRSQSLHVAICPPMLRRPDIVVTQLSGPRARIKAADVQPFGVRFDLRLSAAGSQEQDVLIHFEACCGKPETLF